MDFQKWNRIKEIFQNAVELESSQRDEYLHRACGHDEALKSIILRMIESDQKTDTFLENPPLVSSLSQFNQGQIKNRTGARIGSYVITGILGEGGMGTVFRAEKKDETFHRVAALKVVKQGMDSNAILQRFYNERRILANLEHPNIARLIDGGMTEDGLPYFIMEYVDGNPITEYCDQQQATIKERLQLFSKVCEAVQYAHRNLIVHRDLKPSNILVAAEGNVKLLDFGIAKMLAPEESPETVTITAASFPVMTPEYASPEQIRGERITTASDIYSLGIILYELLSGHRPYEFKTRTPPEIERTIVETDPQRPSTQILQKKHETEKIERICLARSTNPDRLRRELTGDLDNIVMMALRKEPDRRYQSAEQLLNDIRKYERNLPIHARPDTMWYRTSKFVQRHSYSVAVAFILLFVLISGIIATSRQAHIASMERDRAQLETEKAERVISFLQNMLSSANPHQLGPEITVLEVLDEAVARLKSDFAETPDVEAAIRKTIALTYQSLGLYDHAREQFSAIIDIHLKNDLPIHDLVIAIKDLALMNHYLGDYTTADSLYRKAINIHRVENLRNRDYAVVLNDYATLLSDFGEYERAVQLQEQSLLLFLELTPDDHENIGTLYSNLGLQYHYLEDVDKADSLYQLAAGRFITLGEKARWDLSIVLNNLSFVFIDRNEPERALQILQEAYVIRREIFGEDHIEVANVLQNIGGILLQMGRVEDVIEISHKSLSIRKNHLAPHHHLIGQNKLHLARAYYEKKEYETVETFARSAIDIFTNSLGATHWRTASAESVLGRMLIEKGKVEKAEEYLLKSYNSFISQSYQPRDLIQQTIQALITLYEKTGDMKKHTHYKSLLLEHRE